MKQQSFAKFVLLNGLYVLSVKGLWTNEPRYAQGKKNIASLAMSWLQQAHVSSKTCEKNCCVIVGLMGQKGKHVHIWQLSLQNSYSANPEGLKNR